jgi:galactonate dehydratase
MQITNLSVTTVSAGDRNWIFVRIDTNQPGLYGWGEATLEWKTRAVVGAVEDIAPMIIGEDPRSINHVVEKILKHSFWPLGVIGLTALSAIEQALWDILGKDCGRPVWQLLGGKVRDRIRVYAHIGSATPGFRYHPIDVEAYVDGALALTERGYSALKCLPIPVVRYEARASDTRATETLAGRLREAVGPDVDLMFDLHGRPASVGAAVALVQALSVAKPLFVEEPIQPGDPESMRIVADRTGVPLAAGERLLTLTEFRALIDSGAVSFVQPDLCHCGGFSAGRTIAAVAADSHIGVAPHNPMGPIASVVGLHFAAATQNFVILEQYSDAFSFFSEVVSNPIRMEGGHWAIPDTPGLGIDVDERAAQKYPFRQEAIAASIAVDPRDGSFAHW